MRKFIWSKKKYTKKKGVATSLKKKKMLQKKIGVLSEFRESHQSHEVFFFFFFSLVLCQLSYLPCLLSPRDLFFDAIERILLKEHVRFLLKTSF